MNKSNLENQLASFENRCHGILGIDAFHFETKKIIKYRSNEKFLMCSTYKIPIAIYLLKQIEEGIIKINDYKDITEFDLRPGISGTLNQFSYHSPVKVSIENLLRFMMQESCNTSTDFILKLIGGPSAVMNFLKKLDIPDMRVDRYTLDAISQWDGVKIPTDHPMTLNLYKELEKQISSKDLIKIRNELKEKSEDTTTPHAMTLLITKLCKGELINETYTNFLLTVMKGCKRGQLRLLGLLPKNTPIAHKTGTLTGFTSDVGIITLPHKAGRFAISTYIKNSTLPLENNERIIAEVARTVYDYFLLS